jgi:hypothetical protein
VAGAVGAGVMCRGVVGSAGFGELADSPAGVVPFRAPDSSARKCASPRVTARGCEQGGGRQVDVTCSGIVPRVRIAALSVSIVPVGMAKFPVLSAAPASAPVVAEAGALGLGGAKPGEDGASPRRWGGR